MKIFFVIHGYYEGCEPTKWGQDTLNRIIHLQHMTYTKSTFYSYMTDNYPYRFRYITV